MSFVFAGLRKDWGEESKPNRSAIIREGFPAVCAILWKFSAQDVFVTNSEQTPDILPSRVPASHAASHGGTTPITALHAAASVF